MKCFGNTLLAPLDEPTVRQVGGESRRSEGDRKSFSRPQQTIKILKGRDYMGSRKMSLKTTSRKTIQINREKNEDQKFFLHPKQTIQILKGGD